MRASAVVALSAALLLGFTACTPSTSPSATVSSDGASSSRTGPVISPPPVTPPTPPGNNLPAFACKDAAGGAVGTAGVTAVRLDEHTGYDRFVLQFDQQVPVYSIKRQAKPVFIQAGSGQSITLSGTSGVLVVLHSTSQSPTYSGPTDFPQADFIVIKEAKLIDSFEGTDRWGLGLGSPACMRVFTLADPARLVIDFQTPSA